MSASPSPQQKKGQSAFMFAAIIIGLFFIGLVGLLYYGVRRSGDADRDALPSALIGKPAPAFDLPLLHMPDQRLALADMRGKPFVLNVWGSWCPTCRDEHPVLTRFAETRRVRVVGLDWKDERADALRWLAQFGDPYDAIAADPDNRVGIDFGVYGAPETFVIDAKGIIRHKFVGSITEQDVGMTLLPLLARLHDEAGS